MGEMLSGGSVLFPRQQGATGQNLQAFTGALGGIKADAVTNSGNSERPFEVDGDTFTDFNSAAQRSCDNQKNKCAQEANNGGNAGFEVSDCDSQNSESFHVPPPVPLFCFPEGFGGGDERLWRVEREGGGEERERECVCTRKLTVFVRARTAQCKDSINTATQTAFLTLTSSNAEFDFFCEN